MKLLRRLNGYLLLIYRMSVTLRKIAVNTFWIVLAIVLVASLLTGKVDATEVLRLKGLIR